MVYLSAVEAGRRKKKGVDGKGSYWLEDADGDLLSCIPFGIQPACPPRGEPDAPYTRGIENPETSV